MYQENNYSINWGKLILKVIIAFLIIILTVKLLTIITVNKSKHEVKSNMDNNLKYLSNYAKEYYKDKLPKETNEFAITYLKDLVNEGKIKNIKDSKDKLCNLDSSYIKVIKLDKEYQYNTYLVCGKDDNEMVDFVKIEEDKKEEPTTKKVISTTKTISTKKSTTSTTKKVITTTVSTVKTYKVSFNTNGGNYINDIEVKEGEKVPVPSAPMREGYEFAGWYYHGEKYIFNSIVNSDIVLTAKWIEK